MLSQSDKNLIRNAVAWEERFFRTERLLQEGTVPGVELQPWPDRERYAAGVREEILVGPLHPLNEAGGTVLREDGGGVGTGSDDQISQLRLPDGWQEAGTGIDEWSQRVGRPLCVPRITFPWPPAPALDALLEAAVEAPELVWDDDPRAASA